MHQNRSKRLISAHASEKNVNQKVFSFWGLCPRLPDQGLCPWTPLGQARIYVQARGGSCLPISRHLNFFETQINVMRNCVKRKNVTERVVQTCCCCCAPTFHMYVVTCNIFVSWQSYLLTYVLTYLLTSVVL